MSRYPGPRAAAMIEELNRYVVVSPYPFVLDLEKCEGMWLATVDGQRIFDWAGYYGSKLLGHNPPGLQEPDYLRRLGIAANNKVPNPDCLTPECLDYYRLLYDLAPACMRNPDLEVYTLNSGAEAVENLMKYFINLHRQKLGRQGRVPERVRFLYFDQAFHGRTIFALNVTQMTHDPVVTKDFHGIVPGNIQVPFPAVDTRRSDEQNEAVARQSLEIVEEALQRWGDEIAGIVVEPLQGAGGHRVATPSFFRGLSDLAHRHGVSLGFDEVQTAGGPCGAMFAVDLFDLPHPPQAVATAKKLGNGVVYMLHPMLDRGVLDSTWGGSLADMVRFVQEMRIVRREGLLEAVPARAAHLRAGLLDLERRHPGRIANVRGLGLYQGFTLLDPGDKPRLVRRALETEDTLLLGAATDTIRLRPSLAITDADTDLLIQKLDRCLAAL